MICKGAEAKRATTDPFDLENLAEQMLRNFRDISPPSAIEPEFKAWIASLEDVRTTAIAYVDASNTAERRAAGARASAAIQRVYKTQETFPLPEELQVLRLRRRLRACGLPPRAVLLRPRLDLRGRGSELGVVERLRCRRRLCQRARIGCRTW